MEKQKDFYSKKPKENNIQNWDDIFEFQAKKDGANYSMLKEWLKNNFEVPKLKK